MSVYRLETESGEKNVGGGFGPKSHGHTFRMYNVGAIGNLLKLGFQNPRKKVGS